LKSSRQMGLNHC